MSELCAEHRGGMTPGKCGRWHWEGKHLLLGRGQAQQFFQVLPPQPGPKTINVLTVLIFHCNILGSPQQCYSTKCLLSKNFTTLPCESPPTRFSPQGCYSPIPHLHFLIFLVLSSTTLFQGRKIILLSLMKTQFRSVHNHLKLSFSMKSVCHPGFLRKILYFLVFFLSFKDK